ncbi:hypothetical protein AAFF_G00336730 [Aldrovandia affinis]|uniref:Uncharacterized protein n=1 Tax=Aldrovandia affinis TaxID=143900 RepID=A0AAD7R6N9_9TELE|nr:hypothetical protein AAFF_G00336730 [Aldrovandia affinis]
MSCRGQCIPADRVSRWNSYSLTLSLYGVCPQKEAGQVCRLCIQPPLARGPGGGRRAAPVENEREKQPLLSEDSESGRVTAQLPEVQRDNVILETSAPRRSCVSVCVLHGTARAARDFAFFSLDAFFL